MVYTPRRNNISGPTNHTPFPELPLPSKYHKIRAAKITPPEPKVYKPEMQLKSAQLEISEVVVGGDQISESPLIQDKGNHVIENLDLSDYAT